MKPGKNPLIAIYKHRWVWCISAGVIYSLAFFCGKLFFMPYIGLFMLFYKLFDEGDKPLKNIFWFSLGFFVPLYSWFAALYPFEAFDMSFIEGIAVLICGIFGISLVHTAINLLSFSVFKIFPHKKWLLPFEVAACFMISEWLMSIGTFAFPWGVMAVSQTEFLPLLQNVSLFGTKYITFVICVCVGFAVAFVKSKNKRCLAAAILAFVIPVVTGTVMLLLPESESNPIKVAVVQGNISSMDKWDEEKLATNLETYEKLAKQAAASGATLVVLPESTVPTSYNSRVEARFSAIAEEYGCTILIGAVFREDDEKYNSLFALYPDGSRSERYNKQHLVPFGEFFPFEDFISKIFPFLGELNLSDSTLTAGNQSNTIEIGGLSLGALICFDSIFPNAAAESVSNGAEVIAVCTNDSWFESSSGVYQHKAHSVLRAVETGRWVIRAANTGISCFISPSGEVFAETQPMEEDIVYHIVYENDGKTLYTKIGDIIMIFPIGFVAVCAILKIKRRLENGKNKAARKENI